MRALGFAVALASPGRPMVRAVLLSSVQPNASNLDLSFVTVEDEFDLTTAASDWAEICTQFHRDVSARTSTLEPDSVVVRIADFHRSRGQGNGPRLRLVVEGAITAAAMLHVERTVMLSGADCASRHGTTKDVLESDSGSLGARSTRLEAAAAALAALA